jgi:hypothetical protein
MDKVQKYNSFKEKYVNNKFKSNHGSVLFTVFLTYNTKGLVITEKFIYLQKKHIQSK